MSGKLSDRWSTYPSDIYTCLLQGDGESGKAKTSHTPPHGLELVKRSRPPRHALHLAHFVVIGLGLLSPWSSLEKASAGI